MSIQSESNYQPPVFIWFNPKHLLVKNASFCWLIPISANKPLSFQNFGICFAFISVVNYTTFWAGSAGTFFDGARLATRRSRWGAGRAWRAKRWDIAMWVSCSCQWHVYWWCQWWISHDISWYLIYVIWCMWEWVETYYSKKWLKKMCHFQGMNIHLPFK